MDKLTAVSGILFLVADVFAIASLAHPEWIVSDANGNLNNKHIKFALYMHSAYVFKERFYYSRSSNVQWFTKIDSRIMGLDPKLDLNGCQRVFLMIFLFDSLEIHTKNQNP